MEKSANEKDHAFYNFYKNLEDENVLYENRKHQIPFHTPLIEQKKDFDHPSTLYSIKAPFELLHADVANINFFKISSRSSLWFTYWLLIHSKIYTCPIKKRTLSSKKIRNIL